MDILHFDGEPIVVHPGPFTKDDRARIERAVSLAIPAGHSFAALAVLDTHTGEPLEGRIGAAWKSTNDRWKLFGEVTTRWGGDISGTVGILYAR